MPTNQKLAAPNRMVWELFEALRRNCARVKEAEAANNESALRQDAAVCIILAVQCVEVFFNVYFRVLVNEENYAHAAEQIIGDLTKHSFGIDRKIKEWPKIVFGKKLFLDKGWGARFLSLKDLRHRLMHFKSMHLSISIADMRFHGLADISVYDKLSSATALDAAQVAENFIAEIFKLRDLPAEQIPIQLHAWTGKPTM